MNILIPAPLRSYTNASRVDASGATLAAVLNELDHRFPGIRFRMIDEQDRIRRHIRFFIDGSQVFDLEHRLHGSEEILIVQALSGG